jgi:hypothetical protein
MINMPSMLPITSRISRVTPNLTELNKVRTFVTMESDEASELRADLAEVTFEFSVPFIADMR